MASFFDDWGLGNDIARMWDRKFMERLEKPSGVFMDVDHADPLAMTPHNNRVALPWAKMYLNDGDSL